MGGVQRGKVIEEIFNQWGVKYKDYQNLNDLIPNYKTLDFDGILAGNNEVVSLKTFQPQSSTAKTLKLITDKIDDYAKTLSTATLDAAHAGKTRVLDFTVKKGEWDNFMSDIRTNINQIEQTLKNQNKPVIIRLTEF